MRRWTFFIKHFYKKTNQRRWFSLVFPEFFRPKNCQIQRIFHGCVLQLAALQEKVGHITGFFLVFWYNLPWKKSINHINSWLPGQLNLHFFAGLSPRSYRIVPGLSSFQVLFGQQSPSPTTSGTALIETLSSTDQWFSHRIFMGFPWISRSFCQFLSC